VPCTLWPTFSEFSVFALIVFAYFTCIWYFFLRERPQENAQNKCLEAVSTQIPTGRQVSTQIPTGRYCNPLKSRRDATVYSRDLSGYCFLSLHLCAFIWDRSPGVIFLSPPPEGGLDLVTSRKDTI